MTFLFKTGSFWLAALLSSAAGLSAQEIRPPVPGSSVPAAPAVSLAPPALAPDPTRLAKISQLGEVPDWNTLAAYNQTLTREEFETAWKSIYSAEGGLPPPFEITPSAVMVPTGDPTKPMVRIEFRTGATSPAKRQQFSWRSTRDLPPLKGRPPLSDLHIALDPGHIGGPWARMEERFLSFKPGESIQEGDLSLLTAQVLKERLMALGAVVTLVRDKPEPVTELRPPDFQDVALKTLIEAGVPKPLPTYEGVAGDAKILTVQWQTEKLFYRVSEIHARANKVNRQIKPDLVVCLHFNAESWGPSEAPQFSPQNHLHVLVNGCYAAVELEQADTRHEMFSRLFQRVHEEEIPLAAAVADGLADTTRLTPYVYTTPNARHAGKNPYVYARNLLANRLYQCPVVYLEPYVMNHEESYRRLLVGHFVGRTLIGGRLTTSAIEDYVRGVVQGLVSHYQSQRRSS